MNRDIFAGLARCTEAGTNRWIGKLAANPRYQEAAARRYAAAVSQVHFGWVRWRAMHYDRSLRR